MRNLFRCLSILAVFFLIFAVACEGPEGPQGPAGPAGEDGDDGEDFVPYTYLGDNAERCGHCHGDNAMSWMDTHHAMATADLVDGGNGDNPYCLHCHTTGWDSPVSYGDSTITDFGPNTDGYDDAWAAGDTERIEALEGVQCEACHGNMGPTIYDHEPELSYATRLEGDEYLALCDPCHEGQLDEWTESGHAHAIENEGTLEDFASHFGRSSCGVCHTSEYFIAANDADYADMDFDTVSQVGCATCHDPHDATNDAQLRNLDDVTVLYDANYAATYTGYGTGQICGQCHHGRRDVEDVQEQIDEGSSHFGPHHSPQMDMFVGSGCYEIEGYDYEYGRLGGDGHMHQSVAKACVTCHMPEMGDHERPGHSFEPQLEACQGCHAGATDFNINGFQDEIDAKRAQLLALIGVGEEDIGDADLTTVEQRMAAYAYAFVGDDGSRGVHNPKYAERLLDNAIAFLGG